MRLLSIPDICQFRDTTALFSPVKVRQKLRESATKWPKLAKVGQNFALSVQKGIWLEKSTPLPVVAAVTNIGNVATFLRLLPNLHHPPRSSW